MVYLRTEDKVAGKILSGKIRVLLVNENHLVHLGIHTALSNTPDMCLLPTLTDGNIHTLEDLVEKQQPDVLLLASDAIDEPLTTKLAKLREKNSTTRTLVMLSDCTGARGQELLNHGAAGCIRESETPEILLIAIRTVAQGQLWFSPPFLKRVLQSEIPSLTEEELNILRLMVSGKKDKVIAGALHLSQRTVRHRLVRICEKLGVEKRIEAAYQVGLHQMLE